MKSIMRMCLQKMTTNYPTNQVLLSIVILPTWMKEGSLHLSAIWRKQLVAQFLKGQLESNCLLARLRHAPFNL